LTIPDGIVSPAWRQNDAQMVGIAHLLWQRRMVLGDPTGTGKTPQSLIAWRILHHKRGWRALVLMQKAALHQFADSVEKFLVGVRPTVYYGPGRSADDLGDIVITTYDTAIRDRDILLAAFGGTIPVVIADEAHKLKGWGPTRKTVEENPDGLYRRPAFLKLTEGSEYVWALTATPLDNRLDEIAAILESLIPGLFGGRAGFEARYTKRILIKPKGKPWFYKRPVNANDYVRLDEFVDRISPFILRRPISAFGETLPEVDWRDVPVDLYPAQTRLHNLIMGSKSVEGILPATATTDERAIPQTMNRHQYAQVAIDAPAALGFDIPTAKGDALLDLLRGELRDEKVLIYTRYTRVANWIVKFLTDQGVTCLGKISGEESLAERTRLRARFNGVRKTSAGGATLRASSDSGDAAAVAGLNSHQAARDAENPASGRIREGSVTSLVITGAGSESLDLQAARAVVFYNLPYGTSEVQQVVGRARRIGSKHANILVYTLASRAVETDLVGTDGLTGAVHPDPREAGRGLRGKVSTADRGTRSRLNQKTTLLSPILSSLSSSPTPAPSPSTPAPTQEKQ
jgi:SNF2 family DNA or RNA helicase